ncbi:MAG: helix-turn-helix domain-containing protein [Clostridium sp.]|nr:helix-turn-helix domain-containing protein [Clostridium sp.]
MGVLKLPDNLVMLRRKKKKTQEEVADFIGVTKASVSKWENGQSMPDIMLLPQLAAFFDVTIDELMGYEPQLSYEQINKLHEKLKISFAEKGFDYAINECRELVKKYYSCYRFLYTICCLYINHYNMTNDEAMQKNILAEASELAGHILENCKDIRVYNDTLAVKAVVDLMAGRPADVVNTLEDMINNSFMYLSNGTVLIQAYQMLGDIKKANKTSQMGLYVSVFSSISIAILYLASNAGNKAVCDETIERTRKLIELYKVNELHPNMAANFYFQAAVIKCTHGDFDAALRMLEQYADEVYRLMLVDKLTIHGDDFFDLFEEWYSDYNMEFGAPRNEALVWESAIEVFDNPVFEPLKENKKFQMLKNKVERR